VRIPASFYKNVTCFSCVLSQWINSLKIQLIHKFIISAIPVLFGRGTAKFQTRDPESRDELIQSASFLPGLVQQQ
jgi:hypothetical protein